MQNLKTLVQKVNKLALVYGEYTKVEVVQTDVDYKSWSPRNYPSSDPPMQYLHGNNEEKTNTIQGQVT